MTQVNERGKTLESDSAPKKKAAEGKIKAFKRLLGFSTTSFSNKTDISIAQYQTILREKPNDKTVWMSLASVYQKKFQFEKE